MNASPHRQSGATAVIAVVLIVVLGTIGTYVAVSSGVSHVTAGLSTSGIRAWFAAQSGVEWAAFEAIDTGLCPPPGSFNPDGIAFAGFTVTVSCNFSSFDEGAATSYGVFEVTSEATKGAPGDLGHASRTIKVSITDLFASP